MSRTDWKRVQINLDPLEDEEILEHLEKMLEESPFKTKMALLRQIIRIAVPSLATHPMFNIDSAIAHFESAGSSPASSQPAVSSSGDPNWLEY